MKKLVILAPFREEELNMIRAAAPAYKVIFAPGASAEEQTEILSDAEICIGEPEWDAIEKAKNMRLLQMTWAGSDRYTRAERPFPKQIQLCTASGAFGQTMSHYALGAVLSLYHHFPDYRAQQEKCLWKKLEAERSMIGSNILIFGAGDIGSCTAKLFRAAGATEIIGVRRHDNIPEGFDAVCTLDVAEKYLSHADIVIGCMPDTGTNRDYMNAMRLKMMKQDAVLVNMGRGTFVNLTALTEELTSNHLYGAVLDVTNPEPLPKDHPIWKCNNVIITPHTAGPSFGNPQTEHRIAEICCENIRKYYME